MGFIGDILDSVMGAVGGVMDSVSEDVLDPIGGAVGDVANGVFENGIDNIAMSLLGPAIGMPWLGSAYGAGEGLSDGNILQAITSGANLAGVGIGDLFSGGVDAGVTGGDFGPINEVTSDSFQGGWGSNPVTSNSISEFGNTSPLPNLLSEQPTPTQQSFGIAAGEDLPGAQEMSFDAGPDTSSGGYWGNLRSPDYLKNQTKLESSAGTDFTGNPGLQDLWGKAKGQFMKSPIENTLKLGGSLQGMFQGNQQAKALKEAMGRADPFGAQRGGYQQRLADSYSNPQGVLQGSEYGALANQFQQATARQNASRGLRSNPIHNNNAMLGFGMNYMDNYRKNLANLAGAQFGPGASGNLGLSAIQAKQNGMSQPLYALSNIFKGM